MLFHQNTDSGDQNKGKKAGSQLVISGSDPTRRLDFLKKALNKMALFIQPPVTRPRLFGVEFRRDIIGGLLFCDILPGKRRGGGAIGRRVRRKALCLMPTDASTDCIKSAAGSALFQWIGFWCKSSIVGERVVHRSKLTAPA